MKNNRGFTLLELLVVVLIIGIMTAAALPVYEKASRKAKFVQVQSDLKYLMDTIDAYTMENGYVGASSLDGVIDRSDWSCEQTQWSGYSCSGSRAGSFSVFAGQTIRIAWMPDYSKFVGTQADRNKYTISKTISSPWTWTKFSSVSGVPDKNETTQMFCDWWIKTGGRPTEDAVAAQCS